MTTGTPPRRRSPAAPPAEGHRPLRATGYRVPVVLDINSGVEIGLCL